MVRTIKKYTLESFSECTGVGNVVEVGRKSVPGGWATVGETSFPKSIPFLCICTNLEMQERCLPIIRGAGMPFPCTLATAPTPTAFVSRRVFQKNFF